MRIIREQIATPDVNRLRVLGARTGWLIESPEGFRCGIGTSARRLVMNQGIVRQNSIADALSDIELSGDDGPSGSGVVAFGAVPFDASSPYELNIPLVTFTVLHDGSSWISYLEESKGFEPLLDQTSLPTQELLATNDVVYAPTGDQYARMVARAVQRLHNKDLEKVVLARSVSGRTNENIDPGAVVQRLHRNEPSCTIYAMPGELRSRFVGASPELLVRVDGADVSCHPLAGTVALIDQAPDDDYASWLLGSGKNLFEHRVVVNDIVEKLARDCDDVRADPTPSIMSLGTVAHLGTWIRARRNKQTDETNALGLLSQLHPTPAVGGRPTAEALAVINDMEPLPRGLYAGAVGIVDAEGNGEWWMGIRSVTLHDDHFEAWAGAGIVEDSDPSAEREETANKLRTALRAITADAI